MAIEIDETSLRQKFDAALGKGAKRIVDKIMSMRTNDRLSYDFLASMSANSDQDLTNDQEADVTIALGRNGITANTAMSQKILDAFHRAHHDSASGGSLLDQNEVGLPAPGIVILTAEIGAQEGAEASAGLQDETHDDDPAGPAMATDPFAKPMPM